MTDRFVVKGAVVSRRKLFADLLLSFLILSLAQPLDNYKNVVEACRALIDNKRWSKFLLFYLLVFKLNYLSYAETH